MARRRKPDTPPPFILIVENGRLVAENAWDAERLATWANGARLAVTISSERADKMRRKWWAILGKVVKSTDFFPNVDMASEIIKDKIGLVDVWKEDGAWKSAPKSLNDLDEDDLALALQQLGDFLYQLTGVDFAQWNRETPDQGEGIPNGTSDAAHPAASEQAGGASPQLPPPADPDPPAGEHMAGDHAGGGDSSHPPPVDAATAERMREAVDKFIRTATDKDLPDAKERQEMVIVTKNLWKAALPDYPEFVRACTNEADKVVKGTRTPEDARKLLLARIP